MESISSLREELLTALSSPDADVQAQLFDELAVNRQRLLNVLNFGGRNAAELREVESGRVTVNGRSLAVNSEFARQVAFISNQTNTSERIIASLLHTVLSNNPTINEIDAVEQTVLVYHRSRRDLTDCLRYLAESSSLSESAEASALHYSLNDFVRRQLLEGSAGESLPAKIFKEIANVDALITSTKVAVMNAVSNTRLPSAQTNATLGDNVLRGRLESLHYEQRTLAFALYFFSRAGHVGTAELRTIINWLQRNHRSDMTLYVLAAVFAAFDLSHSPPQSSGEELRNAIVRDASFVSYAKQILVTSPVSEWKDPALKAVLSLKWTLLLTESRHRNATLERVEGFRNEDLAMQIFNAIQGDAFTVLLRIISDLSASQSAASQLLATSISRAPLDSANENNGTTTKFSEFKPLFLHEVELLLRNLLTHASSELRKIKHKQEDQFRPRGDHRASFRPNGEAEAEPAPPRNDIATLFQLLGSLYDALPSDSAVQFWGGAPVRDGVLEYYEEVEAELGKLPSFMRWAVEVREPELIISAFDMLSGMSNGVACAECAYNFMASGTLDVIHGPGTSLDSSRYDISTIFTWRSIFGELDSWAGLGQQQRGPGGPPPQLPIAPMDVLLGLAFLKLTTSIGQHSVQARIAVASHPQYRAISCLVSLIPLGVPLELKGAIFETLAAFCQPGAGQHGVEICRNVWAQMERLEVINVRSANTVGLIASKGVEAELEEVESAYRVYPATLPFVILLSTLIHTPKRVSLKSRVSDPEPVNTIPENLGMPYRTPGIGPFVSFVVDNVLEKLHRREYMNTGDMWKMADAALSFLERCLASYDLESLPSLADDYAAKGAEVLSPFVQHPGFEVLSRILSDTPLRKTILRYAVEGAEEIPRQSANAKFGKTILRSLRIIERVLVIQDIFLDHLIPVVTSEDANATLFGGLRISSSFLSRLDQELSLDHRSVPALGSYVAFTSHPELTHLAIKILALLSQSPSFTNIAPLLERSAESDVILSGFVSILGSESELDLGEDVGDAEEWADLWTGAGAPDIDEGEGEEEVLFAQATRLCVLDLLLKGIKHSKSSGLAFLLLFGKSAPENQIQDPHALGSREFCLHVILSLLNIGVPRLNNGRTRDPEQRRVASNTVPLFHAQPLLAERMYKIIFFLCEHPRTSSAMLLYLRTRENFFARHLSAMAMQAPQDARTPNIEVQYGDGSRVTTTCSSMRSFLLLRSWFMDLVSLELHVLTSSGKNQHARVKEMLNLLFGTTDMFENDDGLWDDGVPFNDIGQSRIRLIELFQSLQFEWFDSITVEPLELEFYRTLDLQSCMQADDDGCEVVDRSILFELLSSARRTLLRQGKIQNAAQVAQVDGETRYILESCVVENNRRDIQYALAKGYESWKKLADVVLSKCFSFVGLDQKDNVLFDLLHVIPPVIRSSTIPEASAILLSEVLLLLITKLREEKGQANLLLGTTGTLGESTLPVERMTTLLKHMLDCVLEKQRQELVRGNIYAALVNLLRLVIQSVQSNTSASGALVRPDSTLSNLASSLSLSRTNGKVISSSSSTSLENAAFALLKQSTDKLVSTIARDAIDGTEVWKTISFTLLETLVHFFITSSSTSPSIPILATLDRSGLLSNFIGSLKESNGPLLEVLEREPEDLNPLYVYEAKMSFFVRVSQHRTGASRLLENRILPTLSQVDFLDARPEGDDNSTSNDGFLPSALMRYHELFTPALQLVASLVATVGTSHVQASKQTIDFIFAHRDIFAILLKQDVTSLTISLVEELDLLISLCAMIVPAVAQTDLHATNTGFGSLHNAVLALSSKILGNTKWITNVRPSNESEVVDSQIRASGLQISKFDERVQRWSQKLQKSILEYLSAVSSLGESELVVVLSPISTSRADDRPRGLAAPLSSILDCICTLDAEIEMLLDIGQDVLDAASELGQRDQIRVDAVDEMFGVDVDPQILRRMDIGQRRVIICRVLEKNMMSGREKFTNALACVEMLLHLIWRHVAYYSTNQGAGPGGFDRQRPFSLSTNGPQSLARFSLAQSHLKSSTLRFISVPDAQTFRSEISSLLLRLLQKVDGIELGEEVAGRGWRANQTYLEIMGRCLRELTLPQENETADG